MGAGPHNFTASNRFTHHLFGRAIPHLIKPVPFDLTKENGRVFAVGGSFADRTRFVRENFVSTYPGGPIARNQGRGPTFFNMDASLTKNINFTEGIRGRLRWEVFNAADHPNFGIPSTTGGLSIDRSGGGIGEIVDTVGTEPVMQFSFRLEFWTNVCRQFAHGRIGGRLFIQLVDCAACCLLFSPKAFATCSIRSLELTNSTPYFSPG